MSKQNNNPTTEQHKLIEINKKIGQAEQQGKEGTEYLKSIMADDLIFRRANGDLVGKKEFLEPLEQEEIKYHELIGQGIEVTVDNDTAVVSLLVWAKGQRSGTEFKGLYRNTRVFVKRQQAWQCTVWVNSKVEQL